jgi:hypothetical protein
LRQLNAGLNLFIISSSVPVFEAAKSWLYLFIIPSSGPVFEAAKGWAKSFHYF